MASLMKLSQMPLFQRCVYNHMKKTVHNNSRTISTSKKNSEGAAATCEPVKCPEEKNWVSYGFDYTSKKEDTDAHHASYFFGVTVCLVFGGFLYAYAPDTHMTNWAQREAFLELRRREKACLPPIDPNYIPPHCMKLPTEGELCDVEILI